MRRKRGCAKRRGFSGHKAGDTIAVTLDVLFDAVTAYAGWLIAPANPLLGWPLVLGGALNVAHDISYGEADIECMRYCADEDDED